MKRHTAPSAKIDFFRYPKLSVALVMALTGSVSFARYCPPQYITSMVEPAFMSATEGLTQSVNAVDKALSAQLKLYSERMNSAIAVLTKQKAIAANQIGDANRNTALQTANGLAILAETERVKEARFDYSHEFGQGYEPCKVLPGRTQIATREAEVGDERRARMMTEISAAPGKYADPRQAREDLAKEHRESFCTADQVKSGMCATVGAMAGASLSASTLFLPIMQADPLYKAKVAFVNNVAGLPDAPVPLSAAKTPQATAYAMAKAQKDALLSPALASLKEVQLDNTGIEASHSGLDIPLALRMSKEVKRYLGNTEEYKSWSNVMAGQNSRGLMVEMLKVKSLDLVLLEKQYRQYERMEANLATLVAAQLRGQSVKAALAAEQATRQQLNTQIK